MVFAASMLSAVVPLRPSVLIETLTPALVQIAALKGIES